MPMTADVAAIGIGDIAGSAAAGAGTDAAASAAGGSAAGGSSSLINGISNGQLFMGGSSLLGGLFGAKGATDAASVQAGASAHAADVQKAMFDIINAQQAPYRTAGYNALNQQQNLMNLDPSDPNSLMHKFGANDLNANLAPNWQFALQQGQGATENLANAGGGALSGNSLKGIADYTLNKSGDLYQNAFQNYTANQTNIFNRLASIAGLGQTANQASGTAATAAGGQIGSSLQNAGAATAAGIVGSTNALTGGVNNAASWYGLNNLTGGKLFGEGG